MSELKVQVVSIDEILEHPNAERLELARIAGWNCVVRKGEYKAGDKVVYIPIDSVLPGELEGRLFPPDSKVRLEKSRIRTIKLRGAISQGLVITLDEAQLAPDTPVGTDVAEKLGITKYEPPMSGPSGESRGNKRAGARTGVNSNFHKYTDIENFKHYPNLFEPGELVYVSEKLHGASARYGWFPTEANTFWKKVRKFFGLLPKYEFCLGSRNVQLQDRKYDGFYATNLWGKIAEQEKLHEKLAYGEAIYGEIVGDGVQAHYTYGCGKGEHRFYAYDAQVNGQWLDYYEFGSFCDRKGISRVPTLYVGPYDAEFVSSLRDGTSVIGGQPVREGVVIKPLVEKTCMIGRKVLKYISDTYLLKPDMTDFH